jgi:integrase
MAGGDAMSATKTMIRAVDTYLTRRRALGFQLRAEGNLLKSFARFADALDKTGSIKRDTALAWAAQSPSRLARARRLETLGRFAREHALYTPGDETIPPGYFGSCRRRLTPHVYSDRQIQELISSTRDLRPRDGLRPMSFRCLFGLMACTGLRISEALQLSVDRVDLQRGVLTIGNSKAHRARLVPLHASAIEALRRYASVRDSHFRKSRCDRFFVRDDGQPIGYDNARQAFRYLRRRLGWQRGRSGRLPRMHDLRHRFVCARLVSWYQSGVDVDQTMLQLSRYLGHADPTGTYWYVTAVPTLMAAVTRRVERFTREGDAP